MRSPPARTGILAAVLVASALATSASGLPTTIEECDARVRDRPDWLDSFQCYQMYTEVTGDSKLALARLETAAASRPENPRAVLALATMLQFRNAARANELGLRALELFEREGDVPGRAWAHYRLLGFYSTQLRLEEAEEHAERAIELAEAAGAHPLLMAARVERARMELNRDDLSAAWLMLRGLEMEPGLSEATLDARTKAMQLLAQAAERLGLTKTAHDYARRAVAYAEEYDNPRLLEANLIVLADAAAELSLQGRIDPEEALAVARRAVEMAVERGSTFGELTGRMTLAKLSAESGDPVAALEHLRHVEQASHANPFCRHFTSYARMNMGSTLLAADPSRADEAIEMLRGAVEAASTYGTRYHLLETLLALVNARLQTGPTEAAIEAALDTLDAVEYLTDRQTGEEGGARLLAVYAPTYHAVIDFLLEPPGRSFNSEEIELAFTVSERLRARRLLAHLNAVREGEDTASAAGGRREEVLAEIARIQLELLASIPLPERREQAESELQRLELEEQSLRGQLQQEDFALGVPRWEELVTLPQLIDALGEDEAVLSFVVSPGGARSWLFVVSQAGARAHPLPDHDTLRDAIDFWIGVLQREDGTDGPGATRLYRDLLGDALHELRPSVERLVVIPDGPLHGMPFDALRDGEDARTLVEDFEVTLVPSATLWLRLREKSDDTTRPRALVLADPALARGAGWSVEQRTAVPSAQSIGRLPHARAEARSALRSLNGHGELRLGPDASEAYLKHADLGQFGLLHVAAHAVVNELEPARTAILLAPGDESQDGLLQAREITDLDLDGALVTLSACRSAGGVVMVGEGVMGLARSFFQARAATVIGGLWPLHDRDTAELMAEFYRHLGNGRSVAGALTEAKREMIRKGKPTSAWAGLVVLGAGNQTPWPAGSGRPSHARGVLIASAALVVAIGAGLFFLRRA